MIAPPAMNPKSTEFTNACRIALDTSSIPCMRYPMTGLMNSVALSVTPG